MQAFHEPAELEGWIAPATFDISLILFSGGALHVEQRHPRGSWTSLDVVPGDLILRSGNGRPYEVRWKGLSSNPARTLHLHLEKDLLARTAEEVGGLDPGCVTLQDRAGFRDPLLTQIGLTLWRELELGSSAGKLYAQTAAQMLAVHLLHRYTSAAADLKASSRGLTRRQVKRVTEYILAHLDQDLSLEILAQQVGFSSYHFARLFRKSLGESPHQFVLRQRIEKAQRLLKETDVPLVDIARESGFADQSHLTRTFKRLLGLTPRDYRHEL